MIAFFFLIILSVAGVAFVLWTLKTSPEEETTTPENLSEEKTSNIPNDPIVQESTQEINSLLNKFNFNFRKKKLSSGNEDSSSQEENNNTASTSTIGTASLKTFPADDTVPLAQDVLKENYEQLEKLLKEKNMALENSERALNNELKNRKEFEKIKTLLDAELLDTRQKAKKAQEEITSTSKESQEYKEKLLLLKEKADQLEQKLVEKETDLNELLKRLEQNQKASQPKTLTTPMVPPINKTEVISLELTQKEEKTLEILPQEPSTEEEEEERPPIPEKEKDHKKEFFKFYDESVEIPDKNDELREKSALTDDDVKEIFPEDGFLKLKPDIIDDEGKIL